MDEDAAPTERTPDAAAGKVKLSKADRLEARAARLRDAEDARRSAAEARAAEAGAAEPPPGGPAPGTSSLRLGGWPLVAAGVLALLLVAGLVWTSVRWSRTDSELDAAHHADAVRAGALRTARTYAVDFATYDYAHLDEDSKRVVSHLTPAFAKKYTSVSQQLSALIVQYKGKETATVQGIGVSSVSDKQAVIVAFLDQSVTTSQSKTPQINRYRMKMTMDRQRNGGWLISDMTLE